MSFVWKDRKDIFKGEGIYHLTFAVNNRVPLLGRLRPLQETSCDGHIATVELTELGVKVYQMFNALRVEYPELQILGKQMMPDHFHAVVWVHEGFEGSVKMVARHFSQGCSKVARRLVAEGRILGPQVAGGRMLSVNAQYDCENINGNSGNGGRPNVTNSTSGNRGNNGGNNNSAFDCGNGANTLFSTPYIRTLSHKGQLHRMIDYVHANPDNAWMRRCHPDLYVIRRGVEYAELRFDVMGKARLLDWPERQVVALSRSLTAEQIDMEVRKALYRAETGVVTYTAAINEGEKAVAKAIRTAGYPLVIMMLDGFPQEGTEAAWYFHPSGVYHQACGEGRLFLMAPDVSNYDNAELILRTEEELRRKEDAKGRHYMPIPHSSKRWRMIAGNVMLQMIS